MMNIIETNINELKEYENNPRNNDAAVEAVAESIKEFGFKVPVIIDKDGVIIAGHTRKKAAEKCGSGTTLIACEQTNRICYAMELEPKYCDVIIKRWETMTGEKAVSCENIS